MSKYIFETKMEVRDYECDIEGIVNNANYLHYMEHTRHLFLKECGLSFAEMHNKGVDAVVARMNLQYKGPLQCDDEFLSRLWLEKQLQVLTGERRLHPKWPVCRSCQKRVSRRGERYHP